MRRNRKHSEIEPDKEAARWIAKQRFRESRKIVGLAIIVFLILVLAFVRFGRTIPWGAR